ncbi:MAG TPA: adenylate/guanylate cyclase domain-containing protein [Solirubrobacterales bacterium]|nr:adenylate/guanylate cyclase domain-containing protein [Solirubrobacterales bacterium]
MPELLTGTVTFLFSDIEGSTRLLQAQGDAWPSVLERHQELLRLAFASGDGQEMGTEGDSFFVAFPTAPGAAAAAVAAQRALAAEPWPDDAELRVRIGMHTGEASFSARTYAGLHVHRASRIAAVGYGGQILLSDTTRALVEQALPAGCELRDLGVHRLKDLEHPEHLWQLVVPELRSEFPAIRSLDAVPNNLPTRLTTFLGRSGEIAAIRDLLSRTRLLTLTGPGGTGKTRLSLEVASRAFHEFDAVYFVELAPIAQPDLVIATIAGALGLPDHGGRSVEDRLVDHIGEQAMLLVLDNFEQVLDAAPAITHLLGACPNLKVLVSSRSVLRVSGEQEYPVPPLDLPDPAHLPPLAQLSQYEAVALFIERARAVKPDFEITNENAPAVAEICVRLDGLPLALELAAARIRVLTPAAMLERLEHRLGLLSTGSRDLPERQQTLRGAIAWSHDMLDESDRALFACVSVFVGGAGLDSIEHVCAGEGPGDILDGLDSLVEKSLLRQVAGPACEPRFAMLETIREFAVEQAEASGRWDELRERHAELFASVAADVSTRIMGADRRAPLDRLEEDHDNLRAALSWATEAGRAGTALRMAAGLWRFWQQRGYLAEGFDHVSRALAMSLAGGEPVARADALSAAAGLAYWMGDSERARDLYRQEIEARRELDDRAGLAEALYGISFTWSVQELVTDEARIESERYVEEALALFTELNDASGVARCEWAIANIAWGTDQPDGAAERARRALALFESIGDTFMVGWANYTLGLAALQRDHLAAAGDRDALEEAHRHFTRSLGIFEAADDVTGYTLLFDAFAILAYREGDPVRAARLFGAVETLEAKSGTGLNRWNRSVLGFDLDTLRADPALAEVWAAGSEMTPAAAAAYACEGHAD